MRIFTMYIMKNKYGLFFFPPANVYKQNCCSHETCVMKIDMLIN